MKASQHEYSPGFISINPIYTKLRTYDGNSGTLSPLGQYSMLVYYLELGKTQSRKEQKKNRDGDLLNHPGCLISIT